MVVVVVVVVVVVEVVVVGVVSLPPTPKVVEQVVLVLQLVLHVDSQGGPQSLRENGFVPQLAMSIAIVVVKSPSRIVEMSLRILPLIER